MTQTFADLGIPFPLFAAPAADADGYEGTGECHLCSRSGHVFALGIGGDVIARCAACGVRTPVDAADRTSPCIACEEPVEIRVASDTELRCCYRCLRAGAAAFTKDTTLGMIRWEDAVRGWTHGVPGLPSDGETLLGVGPAGQIGPPIELRRKPSPGSSWVEAALPESAMLELVRTPDFATWQGSLWLFEDQQPMVYIGTWAQRQFREHAPGGDGERLFRAIVDRPPEPWTDWLGEDLDDNGIGVYVFRSQSGERLAATWDMP